MFSVVGLYFRGFSIFFIVSFGGFGWVEDTLSVYGLRVGLLVVGRD